MGPLICGSAQIACRNLAPVGTALKDPFFPRIDNTRNETFSVSVPFRHFSTKEGQHSKYLVCKIASKELCGAVRRGLGRMEEEWRERCCRGWRESLGGCMEIGDRGL